MSLYILHLDILYVIYFSISSFLIIFPFSLFLSSLLYPEGVDAQRGVVPRDGERQDLASQSGVNSVAEDMLVGVVVRQGDPDREE